MHGIEKLLQIMVRLRDPREGCPWDLEQSYESLVPYTLEEAYEVAGAIGRGDSKELCEELCEELGDLLFQVVFYAQIAQEKQHFSFDDVVDSIAGKLVRRHPHVFADASVSSAEEQTLAWEKFKAQERKEKAGGAVDGHGVTDASERVLEHSALDGICEALPALIRAQKIQRRAAREGFDWEQVADVLAKIDEELEECREVMASAADRSRLEEEVGDLLFSCVNLARHMEIDAEGALRKANDKFSVRFRAIERRAAQQGRKFSELALEEMDLLWEQVKSSEE